jgi:PhzF family phenazine biosynthesis protein
MAFPLYQVDAFTDRPFGGNPAAVCLLDAPADALWMQQVAGEMNLSETAFLVPNSDGWALRWFTPTIEVALCGHATLASAHVLWEAGHLPKGETAQFWTQSGLLTASRRGEWIDLDMPAKLQAPAEAPPNLGEALGAHPRYVGRNEFDYLVELDSEERVRSLRPDYRLLRTLSVRGVIVTARSDSPEYDFVSRFFAPGAGIDEDPATGSAHCCLGPFWQERLGKEALTAYQASSRGATIQVRVCGDRVTLGGQAVTVSRGELCC